MYFCKESQLHRLWPLLTTAHIRSSYGVKKILIKGKVETVSLDRVKSAHFECEPETGTSTQRKTQPKTTNSKTTEIVWKDQIKSSSTLTQNSDRTRVKSTANKQTQSAATKIGKNLTTTPQHQAHRVNLPKQFTPDVAPHFRTPAVPRANRSSGGLRTYSRVPLHLRGKTPNTTRPKHRMLEIIRSSPMATKLYQTQP